MTLPPRSGPIRRFAPIERSWLKPPTVEQVEAWRARPRKPIPKTGRKARREAAAWAACRAAVISRSGGWCEGNVAGVCPPHRHGATQVHHVWPEDRAAGRHEPDRCLHLCSFLHPDWIHNREPGQAESLGLLHPR